MRLLDHIYFILVLNIGNGQLVKIMKISYKYYGDRFNESSTLVYMPVAKTSQIWITLNNSAIYMHLHTEYYLYNIFI